MLERSLAAAGEPDFLGFHMLAPQPAWSRADNFEVWGWQCRGVLSPAAMLCMGTAACGLSLRYLGLEAELWTDGCPCNELSRLITKAVMPAILCTAMSLGSFSPTLFSKKGRPLSCMQHLLTFLRVECFCFQARLLALCLCNFQGSCVCLLPN